MRKKLFLFDIDGTIISPGDVGRKLLDRIFIENFNRSPNLQYEDVAGSTDPIIVEKALLRIGEKKSLSKSIDFVILSQTLQATHSPEQVLNQFCLLYTSRSPRD